MEKQPFEDVSPIQNCDKFSVWYWIQTLQLYLPSFASGFVG